MVISTVEKTVVVQVCTHVYSEETLLAVSMGHSNQTGKGLEAPWGFFERRLIDVVYYFVHKK